MRGLQHPQTLQINHAVKGFWITLTNLIHVFHGPLLPAIGTVVLLESQLPIDAGLPLLLVQVYLFNRPFMRCFQKNIFLPEEYHSYKSEKKQNHTP